MLIEEHVKNSVHDKKTQVRTTLNLDSETMASLIEWEKRCLYVAFGAGLLGSLLLLISISTEYWVTVEFSVPSFRNGTDDGVYRGEFYKTGHYHGLWRICRQEFVNNTGASHHRLFCRTMFFSYPVDYTASGAALETDHRITDYRRSAASIGLIGLVLSLIANSFTWYSLAQLRYMFKRLAGSLQLITGACCWVTVEVFKRSLYYEEIHLKGFIPEGSTVDYGFSYGLGWFCFILYVLVGIALLACSRKRKGDRARSLREADENEPVVLGRV